MYLQLGSASVAIGKRRPAEECEGLLADIRALGWSDLQRRAQMETMFCGYCARVGEMQRALRWVRPLVEALEAESARTGEERWRNHLAACEEIVGR